MSDYKATLNLPDTAFPMRGNLANREPEMLKKWDKKDLYQKIREAKAGKKPVILELGGNAGCIVDHDADIDDAIERIVFGAYYQSGQSCIGVQRLFVHSDVYDTFKEKLLVKTKALKSGDPKDPETFIGPMISEGEATRLHSWITDAQERGATLLCGGNAFQHAFLAGDENMAAKTVVGCVFVNEEDPLST